MTKDEAEAAVDDLVRTSHGWLLSKKGGAAGDKSWVDAYDEARSRIVASLMQADEQIEQEHQKTIAMIERMGLEIASKTEAADRVIRFLSLCGEADIEAGIGYLLGNGSEEKIAAFRKGLEDAIGSACGSITVHYHGASGGGPGDRYFPGEGGAGKPGSSHE